MSFNVLPNGGAKSKPSNFHRVSFENHKRKDGRLTSKQRGYQNSTITPLFLAILRRDTICVICEYRPSVTVDHILSKLKGGADVLHNLQGLCKRCHDIKSVLCDGGFGLPMQDYTIDIKKRIALRSIAPIQSH